MVFVFSYKKVVAYDLLGEASFSQTGPPLVRKRKSSSQNNDSSAQTKRICYSRALYAGQVTNGMRDGEGQMCYSDGVYYRGKWRKDHKHGEGEYVYPDGTTYIGVWNLGKWPGEGVITFANGDTYSGKMEKGQPHGLGSWRTLLGSSKSGEWYRGTFLKRIEKEPRGFLEQSNISLIPSQFWGNKGDMLHKLLGINPVEAGLSLDGFRLFGYFIEAAVQRGVSDDHKILAQTQEVLRHDLYSIFHECDFDHVLKRSERFPQVLLGGWKRHSVGYIVFCNRIYVCNRGGKSLKTPLRDKVYPVKGYDFSACKDQISSVLFHLSTLYMDQHPSEDGSRYVYSDLLQIPGVVQLPSTMVLDPMNPQWSGNCAIETPKTTLYMVMLILAQGIFTNKEDAKALARDVYKASMSKTTVAPSMFESYLRGELADDFFYHPSEDLRLQRLFADADRQYTLCRMNKQKDKWVNMMTVIWKKIEYERSAAMGEGVCKD